MSEVVNYDKKGQKLIKVYNDSTSLTAPVPGKRYRETEGLQNLPIVVIAKKFSSRAHVILPKYWLNEYVVAVLEKEKDNESATKIIQSVTSFGNGAHLPVDPKWLGKRVFVKRVRDD